MVFPRLRYSISLQPRGKYLHVTEVIPDRAHKLSRFCPFGHISKPAPKPSCYFFSAHPSGTTWLMTHAHLVGKAVAWLRSYGCGVVLSEQSCSSGEMPDAIGWKRACHSVLIECKVSRADFLADFDKPFRKKPALGLGCERFYLTPPDLVRCDELPPGWGLLELRNRHIAIIQAAARDLRKATGFRHEMNLLLASLRRVEIRIEPQSITDFLKWKNRMAEYNRGTLPEGVASIADEVNDFLAHEHTAAGD